jgi:hypothetical protein
MTPLKVIVKTEDRKSNKPNEFIEVINEYDNDTVMSRKMGFLTKLHNLLGGKYDTVETRYIGFEWIEN